MNTQRTEAQIQASRANGALSRGAVTEEGKARCAQSNTRHGLLSNTILVTDESPAEFTRLLDSLIREFEPQTEGELLMVEELVVCKWRQMRIWSMAAVALSDEIADQRGAPVVEMLRAEGPACDISSVTITAARRRAAEPATAAGTTTCPSAI